MAPLLLRSKSKGKNFSCKSPAATAVCTSIDRRSIVQPTSTRYIDRHTSHLHDPMRSKATPKATPKPSTSLHDPKSRAPSNNTNVKHKAIYYNQKSLSLDIVRRSLDIVTVKSDVKISPPVSSRYLLNDSGYFDVYPEPESETLNPKSETGRPVPTPLLLTGPENIVEISEESERSLSVDGSRVSSDENPKDKVVELRVSLHCKGCQAKVKKHLSKMEGVTSFKIDFATKKVTVIGDVTPLGVLNSISKVKNAQFWPSPPNSSSKNIIAS